jgi:hypothetical protein
MILDKKNANPLMRTERDQPGEGAAYLLLASDKGRKQLNKKPCPHQRLRECQ